MLYVAIAIPLREGFDLHYPVWSAEFWIELVVDVYFFIDIILNFRTAYHDRDGGLVLKPALLAKHYCTGWFVVDVVSILPVNYVEMLIDEHDNEDGSAGYMDEQDVHAASKWKSVKMLRLLRLTKMLRLARIKKLLSHYEDNLQPYLQIGKLVSIGVVIVYIAHCLSCVWYAVGCSSTPEDVISSNGTLTEGWVYRVLGGPKTRDTWSEYLSAFYWATTTLTTVGYGDINAQNNEEMLVACAAELVGGILFGILVGTLASLITEGRMADQYYKQRMESLREFLRVKKVPTGLRRQIRKYFENYYTEKSFDEREVLAQLSPALSIKLLNHIYVKVVRDVAIFQDLDELVLTKICLALQPLKVRAGDHIMEEGEPGLEMYVILSGEVEVVHGNKGEEILSAGASFGELELVEWSEPRQLHVLYHN